jgi:predicted nuclease with TOPRIM domain
MTSINTLIERLRLQKTKLKEEFDRLCLYKDFIEKLKTNYQSIFDEIQSKKPVRNNTN